MPNTNPNIAVIGAGVIGLTTALTLQRELRGARVSIIAENFGQDTTSDVAAGIFRPSTNFSGPTLDSTKRWIKDSYEHYDGILSTSEASLAGVTQLSGYIFSSVDANNVRNRYIEDIVPLYRRATDTELNLCPGNWKYGSFFTTILTECRYYLPWVTRQFEANGGKVKRGTVENFHQLADYDIVMNCTGLGARKLCNDHKIVPLRGQLVKVEAPWVKTFFYGDYDTYIIPGFDGVTLGGCRQYDSYNLNVNKYDGLSIMERCETMLPSLKGSKIKCQRVGLRPHRDVVRVEAEEINVAGKKLKVVHNYGHGGYGVTTAPGTAKYAVELAKLSLMSNSKL